MKFMFTKNVAHRMGDLERGHHVDAGTVALAMYRDLGLLEQPNQRKSSKRIVGAL